MATATEPFGWSLFFSELSGFLRSADRQYGIANEQFSEYVVDRLERAIQSISNFTDLMDSAAQNVDDIETLRSILSRLNNLKRQLLILVQQWQQHAEGIEAMALSVQYTAPSVSPRGSGVGRPRFHITRNQLEYLRSLSFSWSEISSLLGVSRMTVYRRRIEFGLLSQPSRYISNVDLTRRISDMSSELPEIGESMIWGRLRSMGYQVARWRVRAAVRISDPLSTAHRWHGLTSRQPYSVSGPNSLWHIGMSSCNHSHMYKYALTIYK